MYFADVIFETPEDQESDMVVVFNASSELDSDQEVVEVVPVAVPKVEETVLVRVSRFLKPRPAWNSSGYNLRNRS